MKILHITKKYPKALGGDAVAVSNIEKQQRKAGDKVVILTSNCDAIKSDERHVKFGLRDSPAALDKITIRRLLSLAALAYKSCRLIRKEKPDVIHTHSIDMAFAASFAARWYKVPLVHTFHILTFPDAHHTFLRRKTELLFLKAARPKVVTAPNATDVQHLQNAGVTNAILLPHGIDLAFWNKKRADRHDTFTFITTARLEEQKGVAFLIQAAAQLEQQNIRPFKITIVGDGSLHASLQALAKQEKIDHIVEFVGRKTPQAVRKLYASSDVAVVPSLWESGPLTAFEAWGMKVPLIITPVGMFAGENHDSKRVQLVKAGSKSALADGMATLMNDEKRRRQLAKHGYQAVQQHGWAELRSATKAVYDRARQAKEAATPEPQKIIPLKQRILLVTFAVMGIAMLRIAPALSPTINTLITLPLISFVPGLLLLFTVWPKQGRKLAAALTLSAALGLLLIAIEGALLNWLLPIMHNTEPLQAKYLVPTHTIVMTVLLAWYYKKAPDKQLQLAIGTKKIVFAVMPLLLPILAAAGAFRQNNGASSILTLITFASMAVVAAWYVWKPKLWNASWLLFNIALGLLLSTSLRSWFVSGFDISQELQVFSTTLHQHYWNIHALPGNAYNACLSLTTLPTALQQFTGVSPETIFKFFYPVVFALTAVLTYLIGRRFVDRWLAFLAGLLYAAQAQFIGTMPAIARQEIGLLFFGLLIYLLFDTTKLDKARKALLMVLATGMVLTHYSTTYLSIMIFGTTALILIAAKTLHGRIPALPKFTTHLNAGLLLKLALFLLILTTIWYSQINGSSNGVLKTIHTASHLSVLHIDTHSGTAQLLLGGNQDGVDPKNVAKYTAAQKLDVPLLPISMPTLPTRNHVATWVANTSRDVVAITLKLLLPLSPILLLYFRKTRQASSDLSFVGLGAVFVFAAVIILPGLSASYNLQRVYQQCLILLGATGLWAFWQLLPVGKRLKTLALATFVIGYFLLSPGSALVNQVIGGVAPRMTFNNYGEEYDKYYVRESEVLSAAWFAQNCQDQTTWADRYATLRLTAYGGVPYDNIYNNIFNAGDGCLYLDYANTHENVYYANYKKS
ncbi:MAG TPA: glycosyltransferase, partial [Patescibacteria group bacterium]|nr:glycosyltransferase [Patescibacteria group bacterium]